MCFQGKEMVVVRRTGFEPVLTTWQAAVLAVEHQRHEAERVGFEPTDPFGSLS